MKYTKQDFENTVLSLLSVRPFYGIMVQQLNVSIIQGFPTAGINYDTKYRKFNLYLGPDFMASLSENERGAVIIHELQHITHKHVFYDVVKLEQKRFNIAMDLVINQNIADLPKEALLVENFKDKHGNPFPLNKTTEEYYDLLDGAEHTNPETGERTPVEMLGEFDEHNWEEVDKEEATKAAKALIDRTVEKTSSTFSSSKNETIVKDLQINKHLSNKISELLSSLNYKQLLAYAIKRSMPCRDKQGTWTRPNRRFGYSAQGKKHALKPRVKFLLDTSGSISVKEFDEAMGHCNKILEVLQAQCDVSFFHTNVYGNQKMKKGKKIDFSALESGGTELKPVIEDINKSSHDLFIVITDGCYSDVDLETKKKIIFLISKSGNTEHPLKRMGKTVQST